jgi:hypothetical protein
MEPTAAQRLAARRFVSEQVRLAEDTIEGIEKMYGTDQAKYPPRVMGDLKHAKSVLAEHAIGLILAKRRRGEEITEGDKIAYIHAKRDLDDRPPAMRQAEMMYAPE